MLWIKITNYKCIRSKANAKYAMSDNNDNNDENNNNDINCKKTITITIQIKYQ